MLTIGCDYVQKKNTAKMCHGLSSTCVQYANFLQDLCNNIYASAKRHVAVSIILCFLFVSLLVCLRVPNIVNTVGYIENYWTEFHQPFSVNALWDKDEYSTFGVKG